MRNYFYFRTATDVADDDGGNASGMFPVDKFRGAIPSNSSAGTAANVITLFFESALNEKGAGQNGEVIIQDTVVLNVTVGKSKEVLQAICEAANGHPHTDGITVVADDTTNDANAKAVYLHPDITSCGNISIASVLS